MPLDMTPEQRERGSENFQKTSEGLSRRGFMKAVALGTAAPLTAAAYFGYEFKKVADRPVQAGLIGAGDEGGVLVGEHNPHYLEFIAYQRHSPLQPETHLRAASRSARARASITTTAATPRRTSSSYENYKDLLPTTSASIEAVVIALPLNLHARSPSRPWRPASTCCAKSSWPGTSSSARR